VLDALGLAPHERIASFIHIGEPPSRPEGRPRPPAAHCNALYRLAAQKSSGELIIMCYAPTKLMGVPRIRARNAAEAAST
jgi:hypothetical protein